MKRSHRIASRRFLTALVVIALVAFVGATSMGRYSPVIALKVASGIVSHQICSSVFVSHLDAGEEFREIVPTLGPLRYLASLTANVVRAAGPRWMTPPIAGPTARARLNSIPFSRTGLQAPACCPRKLSQERLQPPFDMFGTLLA
jgi:hypothetical protein